MIWGVDDNTHELIGTKASRKKKRKVIKNLKIDNIMDSLKNTDFEIHSDNINRKHIEILIISKAVGVPITFEKVDYVRVGSYTKKIIEFCPLLVQLWNKLKHQQFEDAYAISDINYKIFLTT